MATVPAALIFGAVPAGIAAASTPTASAGGGADHDYVVILRNQNSQLGANSAARQQAVTAEQGPVLSQVHSLGGREVSSTSLVNAVVANMTASNAQAIAANPAVAEVVPNQIIPGPTLPNESTGTAGADQAQPGSTPVCSTNGTGTPAKPQLNPEALYSVNGVNPGADGAGVKVALLADGLNPANPDFKRNKAYASAGSRAGSAVVTEKDFSSDGTSAPTAGGEAFLDASSIAAQANKTYNLNEYLAPDHQIPGGCYIKIRGVAPGADVLALKVFAQNNDTTTSGFLQAVDYAVSHGAKVINESFGSNNFPDLAKDVIRQADDAAVRAGVTVVVSSGDAGLTSTIGSPASDPNVISVGATTTFRAYSQSAEGGINAPGVDPKGRYVSKNISSLSSGGYTQAGRTVDLVAPGDLNWLLCDSNTNLFSDCTNDAETAGSDIQLTGGTSEASPLTAGAAADVIQAYAETHYGKDPKPALVKQILMSTATDIDAPATQQGAGLLNVGAAVKLARSIGDPSADGGLLLSPGQVNVSQKPFAATSRTISVTNTSSHAVTVSLSTRTLSSQVGSESGSFCLQPSTTGSASCPANTGSFAIWSGVTEVYQVEHFTVPHTSGASRLEFTADYPLDSPEQTSLMHVALFEPNGAYAGYSLPQGLGDYANVQVANPPAGNWTAVFFTELDGATSGGVGTSGTVQWQASTLQYSRGSRISPSTLHLGAGATGTARLKLTSPGSAGDTSESVVVSSSGRRTTIPVTIRTVIPTSSTGGSFSGVLTGGNGRAGAQAQANYYVFNVPKGAKDLHAEVNLANDPNDAVTGYLIDPTGQVLGYSTNVTLNASLEPEGTTSVDLYHARPAAGKWTLALQWANPVSGMELSEPFTGTISFAKPQITGNLPVGKTLTSGNSYTYSVQVYNSSNSPEAYFVDPRLNTNQTLRLPNENPGVEATNMTLPLPAETPAGGYSFPYYIVPTQTSKLEESLSAKGRIALDFDSSYFPGDPDLEGVRHGDSASLTYSNAEVSPGLWDLNPAEIGPFGAGSAPTTKAEATVKVVTKAFDSAITSDTGDAWTYVEGLSSSFTPLYLPPGTGATITVTINATGKVGSTQAGTLFVDDVELAGFTGVFDLPNGDEVAALPFSYKIGK